MNYMNRIQNIDVIPVKVMAHVSDCENMGDLTEEKVEVLCHPSTCLR
jgi:hypothetical protein